MTIKNAVLVLTATLSLAVAGLNSGCSYSSESLYPRQVSTVCVEMFDNRTFWRGQEYDLTDALCKRIETDTPYRVLSDKAGADTVLSGYITSVDKGTLILEPQVGRPLQQHLQLTAVVTWKDRRTGELLLDKAMVTEEADFSQFQGQGEAYASRLAADRLAAAITNLMREKW
jgi:hypothetical protein